MTTPPQQHEPQKVGVRPPLVEVLKPSGAISDPTAALLEPDGTLRCPVDARDVATSPLALFVDGPPIAAEFVNDDESL